MMPARTRWSFDRDKKRPHDGARPEEPVIARRPEEMDFVVPVHASAMAEDKTGVRQRSVEFRSATEPATHVQRYFREAS